MWYVMEQAQRSYTLSERLLQAIGLSRVRQRVTDPDELENVILEGADVNQPHGTLLPLHCACMMGDARSVQILISKGAKVNALDGYHRTALHHAAEHNLECVKLLLQHNAETEARDINNNTPLHWAAFKNKADCVRALLEWGADVNAVDFNNDTPLSWAAMKGNLESCRVLLEFNASVDIKNCNGITPLGRVAILLATGLNSIDDDICYELLIQSSGQFDLRGADGCMPPIIARDHRLNSQLVTLCSSTRSLRALCRFAIRKAMGQCHMPTSVPKLPIPAQLYRFLLLE